MHEFGFARPNYYIANRNVLFTYSFFNQKGMLGGDCYTNMLKSRSYVYIHTSVVFLHTINSSKRLSKLISGQILVISDKILLLRGKQN